MDSSASLAQPLNYLLGGPGTGMIGDPNVQVNERKKVTDLWKSLAGR
jgi:tyrosyl-tRNA synthetase